MGDRGKLPAGIYEHVLNQILFERLNNNSDDQAVLEDIDEEEASRVLSKYLSEVIEKVLSNIKDSGGGIYKQISLCNDLIKLIVNMTEIDCYRGFL